MTTYNPSPNPKSSTLAGAVDTFIFAADRRGRVYVLNQSAALATASVGYGTAAGDVTDPTANGDNCYPIPAGAGRWLHLRTVVPPTGKSIIVKVLGTGVVTVELAAD